VAKGGAQHPVLARMAAAEARRRLWDGHLDEAFRLALPNHESYQGTKTPGENRTATVYDSTAPIALMQRAARDQEALMPSARAWMAFDYPQGFETASGGDPATDPAAVAFLQGVHERFHGAVAASNLDLEIVPALMESHISVGTITVHPHTARRPLRFETVPTSEIIVEEGIFGTLDTTFRKFTLPYREVMRRWPDADLGQMKPTDEAEQSKPVKLCDAMVYRPESEDWEYLIFADGQSEPIQSTRYRTNRRIAFRTGVAPGEAMGRGRVLDVLGSIQSANKALELILKNASIAMTGMWQADDDGVINLQNIQLVPGAIIPKAVGSAGLQPLRSGIQLDLSQIVLEDLRRQIREHILGPGLPPAVGADRRTAFEISERVANQAAVEVPQTLRLMGELQAPLAAAILDVLSLPEMAASPYYIAPFEVDGQHLIPVPKPPLAKVRQRAEAQQAMAAIAAAAQFAPEAVGAVLHLGRTVAWFLRQSDVQQDLFKTEAERQADQEQAAQAQQAALVQQLGQTAGGSGGGAAGA